MHPKKILNHKANIDPVTLFFGCKKLLNSKGGMHGQNCNKKDFKEKSMESLA